MNILGKRSGRPFSRKSDRTTEKITVSFTHEQNIICSQILKAKHSWTALRMSRPLFVCSFFAGQVHGGLSANEKKEKFASNDSYFYFYSFTSVI